MVLYYSIACKYYVILNENERNLKKSGGSVGYIERPCLRVLMFFLFSLVFMESRL